MLLRRALPALIAELGEDHPFTEQAMQTLASQLRDDGRSLTERLAIYRGLATSRSARYGEKQPIALSSAASLGYVQAAAGQLSEANATFERAIDGYLIGPRPREAERLLPPLASACRQAGVPARTGYREHAILHCYPSSRSAVRTVRLARVTHILRSFNAQAVQQMAEVHFPAFAPQVRYVVGRRPSPGCGHEQPHSRGGPVAGRSNGRTADAQGDQRVARDHV